jgi:hypothetical protein
MSPRPDEARSAQREAGRGATQSPPSKEVPRRKPWWRNRFLAESLVTIVAAVAAAGVAEAVKNESSAPARPTIDQLDDLIDTNPSFGDYLEKHPELVRKEYGSPDEVVKALQD